MASRKRVSGKKPVKVQSSISAEESIRKIEPRVDLKAIIISTVFNLSAVIVSFFIFYMSMGVVGGGFYYSFIVLAVVITITVLGWILWTFRVIKDRKIAALISLSMIIILAVMLLIIWQVVTVLGALI